MSETQALDAEEFDEFAKENWGEDEMYPADASLWVEDWDDDKVDDEFAKKLKEELAKAQEAKPATPPPAST